MGKNHILAILLMVAVGIILAACAPCSLKDFAPAAEGIANVERVRWDKADTKDVMAYVVYHLEQCFAPKLNLLNGVLVAVAVGLFKDWIKAAGIGIWNVVRQQRQQQQ